MQRRNSKILFSTSWHPDNLKDSLPKESTHCSGRLLSGNKYEPRMLTPFAKRLKQGLRFTGSLWSLVRLKYIRNLCEQAKSITFKCKIHLPRQNEVGALKYLCLHKKLTFKVLILGEKKQWDRSKAYLPSQKLEELRYNWCCVLSSAWGRRGGFGNLFRPFPILQLIVL